MEINKQEDFKFKKEQVFRIKFNEVDDYKDKLNKQSGLYMFHIDTQLIYVGKAVNLWRRMGGYQLGDNCKQHINQKLLELIKSNPSVVKVAFAPMDEELLKGQETLFIQEFIPLSNEKENPRYEIHPIQKVIGRVVVDSNHEWKFSKMRQYLSHKWKGKISLERIDEALEDKHKNLKKCNLAVSQKKKTLNPKKKK